MSVVSHLELAYLFYLSKPAAERSLYRQIQSLKPAKIFEIGIGSGQRALRMLQVAQRFRPLGELRYAGVDLFEGRPANAQALTLKNAYVMFKATGVRSQLVPGDPYSGLVRAANSLRDNDLLLIAGDQDEESLAQAWFYVPRMLHANSLVLRETLAAGGSVWQPVSRADIDQLAAARQTRRRAA